MFEELVAMAAEKKLVLLGESAHGAKEFNSIRVQLIRELNSKAGFDVVMMEGSPPEMNLESFAKEPSETIRAKIHPVYQTREVLELIEFILTSGMTLAGFEMSGDELQSYQQMKSSGRHREALNFRDRCMFQHVTSLWNGPLSKRKTVIWAHNNHLMRQTSTAAGRDKVMGELLNQAFGDEMYVIGQYAGSGDFEHMPGQKVSWPELRGRSLPDFIISQKGDLSCVSNVKGCLDLQGKMATVMGSGTEENLDLSACFDALILHRSATPVERI